MAGGDGGGAGVGSALRWEGAQPQLGQVTGGDGRGRVGERGGARLGLWEGGAWGGGSPPDWVVGKPIPSRMFSSPTSSATSRSMPKANPAWGGAPSRKAATRNPNACQSPP